MYRQPGAAPAERRQTRTLIEQRRSARPASQRLLDDQARASRVLDLVSDLLPPGRRSIVACYLSRPPEPGTAGLITDLAEHHRLLVPKLGAANGQQTRRAPDWAWLDDPQAIGVGPWEIPDPLGPGLGITALAAADLVIAAALCAGLDGSRLGTGGGWYDRALPYRRPGVPVVVLLNDDEVGAVPQEPHDQPVDWLITATRTIRTATELATGIQPNS